VQKSSASPPIRGQPHQPLASLSDTHAAHFAFPFQKATPEEQEDPTSQSSQLPWRPTGASGKPRRVPEEDDDGEGSTEHHARIVAPHAPSGKEIARLEHGHLIELERQLSETLVAKTERDRHIAQLTDKLALKSALLEQAQAYAAKLEERTGLELRKLQAKLDESLLSRDLVLQQAEANAAEEKKRAGLELRELQAKLDDLLLSRDLAIQQAEANAAEEKKRALRELQAKFDESLLSRDHALEQAQSALQKASCAAEANEQSQRELTEMRAELEASKSESAAFRSRFADTENGCGKSKAEANTYRTQTGTGLANTDEDQVVHRLMERVQAMEAKMASSGWNEKSFEMMECRNEG
jgi:chromosome segregation ATPase